MLLCTHEKLCWLWVLDIKSRATLKLVEVTQTSSCSLLLLDEYLPYSKSSFWPATVLEIVNCDFKKQNLSCRITADLPSETCIGKYLPGQNTSWACAVNHDMYSAQPSAEPQLHSAMSTGRPSLSPSCSEHRTPQYLLCTAVNTGHPSLSSIIVFHEIVQYCSISTDSLEDILDWVYHSQTHHSIDPCFARTFRSLMSFTSLRPVSINTPCQFKVETLSTALGQYNILDTSLMVSTWSFGAQGSNHPLSRLRQQVESIVSAICLNQVWLL